MANALHVGHKHRQLGGTYVTDITVVDYVADAVGCDLMTNQGGTVDANVNHDWADIRTKSVFNPTTPNAAVGNTLTSKVVTYTANTVTIDAGDATFTSVSGSQVASLTIFKHGTTYNNSTLCVFFDTATGLPVTPNGGNIVVQWHANGVFTW